MGSSNGQFSKAKLHGQGDEQFKQEGGEEKNAHFSSLREEAMAASLRV